MGSSYGQAGTKGTAYDSMTDDCLVYWSSSEYSTSCAVRLFIDATDSGPLYGFWWDEQSKENLNEIGVRPVLAF